MKSTLFSTNESDYQYSQEVSLNPATDGQTLQEPMNLRVTVYNDLDTLPEYYDSFFKKVAIKDFFSSRDWFKNIINTTLNTNTELFLYGIEEYTHTPTPKVLLITTRAVQNRNGAKINGWWLPNSSIAGLTNFQCYSHTYLYPENTDNLDEITSELVNHLKKEKRPVIDLNLFPKDSECQKTLNKHFNLAGMTALNYEYCSNWVETTEHTNYEKYLANRSKSTRKGILRKRRRLEENHDVKIEILSKENDAERAISLFNEVYSASWKEPEYFQDFTPGLIRTCAKNGTLRLGVLYIDEQAASVEFSITANRKTTFAKSAYNTKFSEHSASSILLLHMIEHSLEMEKSKLLSFGLFDDDYKKSWCKDRRLIEGIVIFNTSTLRGCIGLICYKIINFKNSQLEKIKPRIRFMLKKFTH